MDEGGASLCLFSKLRHQYAPGIWLFLMSNFFVQFEWELSFRIALFITSYFWLLQAFLSIFAVSIILLIFVSTSLTWAKTSICKSNLVKPNITDFARPKTNTLYKILITSHSSSAGLSARTWDLWEVMDIPPNLYTNYCIISSFNHAISF